MNPIDAEVIEQAQQANPHYYQAVIRAMGVMAERRKKYSGDFHPYYNFVDVARRTGQTAWRTLLMYLGMKSSRLAVSGDKDFADESVADTLVDIINYAALALGWVMGKLTEEDVIPVTGNQWEKIWPVLCLDFDGVFNQHKGWTGKYELPAKLDGIDQMLKTLNDAGYTLIVCTARPDDILLDVASWLEDNDLMQYIHEVTNRKPPAVAYLDDRAVAFTGDHIEAAERVKAFKPYWEE